MTRIDGHRVAFSNAEKIGLSVAVVTLLALGALASIGLRSTPPQPWLNLGKRASLITVCSSGIGLALLSAAVGRRIFSKQKPQPPSSVTRKNEKTNNERRNQIDADPESEGSTSSNQSRSNSVQLISDADTWGSESSD